MTRLVPCDPIAAKPFVLLQCKMLLRLPLILVLLRVHILPQHHLPEQHSDKSNQPKHYPANPRPEADGMPCESTVVDIYAWQGATQVMACCQRWAWQGAAHLWLVHLHLPLAPLTEALWQCSQRQVQVY